MQMSDIVRTPLGVTGTVIGVKYENPENKDTGRIWVLYDNGQVRACMTSQPVHVHHQHTAGITALPRSSIELPTGSSLGAQACRRANVKPWVRKLA
jgi:hypothetical protein